MTNTYAIKGAGQLEKRGPRKWRIRVSLGYDPIKKKYIRSPSRTVEGTKADALEALIAYKEELRDGTNIRKINTKVKDYAWESTPRAKASSTRRCPSNGSTTRSGTS